MGAPIRYIEKKKGYGFVEFAEEVDAAAAIDNMNDAELFGNVIKVNIARTQHVSSESSKAIWQQSDVYYEAQDDDAQK
jgi:peptidyl-prolyl isomerase E (cyclophilin E)